MPAQLDHFATDTPDQEWLRQVGGRGWIVLTKDSRNRTREMERRARLDAGAVALVLTAGDLTGAEMAQAFVKALPRRRKTLRDYAAPFLAGVDASGRAKLLSEAPRAASRRREE